MTQFWFAASTEEFPPSQMLEQARAAERAGFDGLGALRPLRALVARRPGQPGLGVPRPPSARSHDAAARHRRHADHPSLPPGASWRRPSCRWRSSTPAASFLGAGSGEALNEVPLGLDWPEPGEMLERFEAGLEAITRLWDGETVTMDGGWFRLEARPSSTRRAPSRAEALRLGLRPAGGARSPARYGDGLWTLGDPESRARGHRRLPRGVRAARPRARRDHPAGRASTSAEDEETAIASARKVEGRRSSTRSTATTSTTRPRCCAKADGRGQRRAVRQGGLHRQRRSATSTSSASAELEAIDEATTTICLQRIGDADPLGSIRRYGEHVLPALRSVRTA